MPGFILGTSKLGEDLLGPVANAQASLQGLSANATATVSHFATGASEFGLLNSTASAGVTNYASASATLGALTASANSIVQISASATSQLGSLTAQAQSNVTNLVQATALLGALSSTANADVENVVTATAALGTLNASAQSQVTHFVSANANLGELNAAANTQPETPQAFGGVGSPSYVQPNLVTPFEKPIAKPTIQEQFGIDVVANLGGLVARASSQITFSSIEDESELLLLI